MFSVYIGRFEERPRIGKRRVGRPQRVVQTTVKESLGAAGNKLQGLWILELATRDLCSAYILVDLKSDPVLVNAELVGPKELYRQQ
ncbi:jg22761 [Pararge aegeria aegeria]|uniref:Jg22761 protein n=1 Tax=Pararge aegeria aegeria TaxID=348720 RepID=A0A8S4QPF2_9NEOP|nr:jg22761 [Pararge aegeria aegeria]